MNLLKIHGGVLCVLLCVFQTISAQEIKIGDKAPIFDNVDLLNYHKPSLSLDEFKGKILLLDFWNTYCTACLKAFPKLDSLQKRFKNEIQIVLVNSESKEKTKLFFEKHNSIHKPLLPMITNDRKLKNAFPSSGQPYVVWIDKHGTVQNFSGGTSVSALNIKLLIQGKKLSFRNPTKERHGSAVEEEKFEFISYISHCVDSLNVGHKELQESDAGKSATITSNCSSVISLFQKAFGEYGKYNFETLYGVELKVKDSFPYLYPDDEEKVDYWLSNYAYNYQLIVPKKRMNIAYQIMQQNLLDYFDCEAKVIKKEVYGVRLQIADSISLENIRHKNFLEGYAEKYPDSVIIFKDQSFEDFTNFLNGRFSYFFPYKDDTRFRGNISLIIRESSITPYNHKQFIEDLAGAGLTCTWGPIETNVLIINEK